MRKAQLPNGQILAFPDNTSDSVISSVVDRIAKTKTESPWTTDQVKAIIRELNSVQAQIDIEKAKVDNYGPAIDKQIKVLEKQNKNIEDHTSVVEQQKRVIEQGLAEIVNKLTVGDVSGLIKDAVKQFVMLNHNIGMMNSNNKSYINELNLLVKGNATLIDGLISAQNNLNQVLEDMVKTSRLSKKIIRDKNGNITSVRVE